MPLMLAARDAGLAVRGMSFHVGSQCRAPEDFHTALLQARRIWDRAAAAGIELEVLDIGGGFPAPYRDSVLSLDAYCRSLARALDETFGDLNRSAIRVIAEPGRGLVADSMSLITRVIGKSMRGGTPWYIIDDGLYGSFSGQMFDHVEYPLIARNADERAAASLRRGRSHLRFERRGGARPDAPRPRHRRAAAGADDGSVHLRQCLELQRAGSGPHHRDRVTGQGTDEHR